jgi:O-antigen/teichoic acid export membrane protein
LIRRNIFFGLLGQGLLIFLSLISTHLVFKELGAEVLGIMSFALTATFLMIAFADMGSSVLVAREVAAHRHGNMIYVRELTSSVAFLSWLMFGASCLIMILFAPLAIEKWLHLEHLDTDSAVLALQVISVALLLAIPRAVYGAVVSGYERMDLWNVANVLTVGIQQLGMIAALFLGGSLFQVATWYALSAVIALISYMLLVAKIAGVKMLRPKLRLDVLRRNFHFGSRIFANSMVGYLVTQIDRWTVSKYLPLSVLGYYGFAQSLVSKGAIVPGAIANAAFPALSTSVATNHNQVWLTQYYKLQDLCCYIYAPVSAAVAMLGIAVTSFVLNDAIAQVIWLPLVLLAIGQFLLGTLAVPYWLSIAMKKPSIALRTNLWALITVVPLTVLMTSRIGLVGAAFSSVLYSIWQLVYFVPRFCSECLEAGSWRWYRRTGAFVGLVTVIYGVMWIVAFRLGEGLSAVGLVSAYVAGTVTFAFAGWFVIGNELRGTLHQVYNGLIARFTKAEICPDYPLDH